MENNESPTSLSLPTDFDWQKSPLYPSNLFDLYFRPHRFFARLPRMEHIPSLYLSAWICGIARYLVYARHIDPSGLLAAQGDGGNFVWHLLTNPWLFVSIVILVIGGALNVLVMWYPLGWWYQMRIHWSGEPNPDGFLARQVYFYSGIIVALGDILWTLFFVTDYANERNIVMFFSFIALSLLLFIWSIIVSYIGIQVCFQTTEDAARLWFIVLPSAQIVISVVVQLYRLRMSLQPWT